MAEQSEIMRVEAVVVGAGFGGLHMLHKLRELGIEARLIEAADDVGGTWHWNRYPGARCDVESVLYSYSFSPVIDAEWRWSQRYADHAEIKRYLQFVADRLDLRKHIRFNERVERAQFDDDRSEWVLTTSSGQAIAARFCIMATGPLTVGQLPDIPGRDEFAGTTYHSARWPQQKVDFTGKRVGVVGTGSSGTQLIPPVAEEAKRLFVFQRTANFTVQARNYPMTEAQHALWAENAGEMRVKMRANVITGAGDAFMTDEFRAHQQQDAHAFTPQERQAIFEERWRIGGGSTLMGAFRNVMTDEATNEIVSNFVRGKIREVVVDRQTAEDLQPSGFPIGAKRLCVGTDFYETFNRPNVELVNLRREPIVSITPTGIQTEARHIELDAIVFATGFDAMTGALTSIDIVGSSGRALREDWRDGARSYLGLTIHGFPNLLTIGGPGSPSALTNVVMANEQHVDFIGGLLAHLRAQGFTRFEASEAAQQNWATHCAAMAERTLFGRADSWYLGANVPGKPRVVLPYTGGFVPYREKCDAVASSAYDGFTMR